MTDPLFYDSLQDPNLQSYFGHKNVQKHLRKVGFLNRHGEIVPDKEYQTAIKERSRQEQVRTLLSQGIVQRVIELEKTREANLRNQFELTKRKLTIEKIKESKLKSKQFHSKDFLVFNQIKTPIQINDQPKIHSRRLNKRRSLSPRKTQEKKINIHENTIEITMIYRGNSNKIYSDDHHSNILIMQQHCGTQNICVFKKNLKMNEKFQFKSYRQKDYPFALTFYVDDLIDSRISVCCEYKHKLNVPLGGQSASFAILNVQGGRPCQTCRFNAYLANHHLVNQTSLLSETMPSEIIDQTNAEKHWSISSIDDEFDEAKQIYFEINSKIDETIFTKQQGLYHYQLGNICKEGLLNTDLAYEHYLNSLEIFLLYYSSNNIKLRPIYLNLAHLLILKNETNLAKKYFQRILDIDYSFKYINYSNLITIHYYLALVYFNENKYEKSFYHLNKCLRFYLKLNNKTNFEQNLLINQTKYDEKAWKSLSLDKIPLLADIHYYLSIIYEKFHDQTKAFEHIFKAMQLEKVDQNKQNIYEKHLNYLQNN